MSDEYAERITARLTQVPLFHNLPLSDLKLIPRAAQHREVPRNAYFFREGDVAAALYVLDSGQVRITQLTPEGEADNVRRAIIEYQPPSDCSKSARALQEESS